jgi:hypothetical protein
MRARSEKKLLKILEKQKKSDEEGAALFVDKGCLECHSGPRGSGLKLYTFEEIGTDAAMKDWGMDLTFDAGDPLTQAIKSPRLNGLWAMRNFLRNGSVDSLESLFCLDGPRGDVTERPFGNGGHDYTCNELTRDEKLLLIDYMRAH